ncbi:lysophospholipid acyltransferase family protein [Mucilaginibacter ginkgonis]|uniref:Lysophospholipid acyltransferase family protein n=1 Tax=Mucilaginibacter ginkgonis TaxID=2682091 RepID=A0A6I4HXR3_9SPHI|nr:lysophospholipid acyltransferase family protein [Mucilaginibacter ginkgonis]QQL51117.1 lysophospholipid acyltransferase family protein [Mucilaginibacter ginkgonis]
MIKKALASLVVFFLYLLSLLPLAVLYVLSDVLYIVTYYLIGYRRKVVAENLKNSFPEKTEAELNTISKKYYRYLCDLMVETIKLLTMSQAEVTKRVDLYNTAFLEETLASGKSIICVNGHYGNWELGALRLGQITNHKRIIVYKPISNEAAESVFTRMRSRFGATLVPMKSILRTLVALKNEPTISVFVSDQTPVKEEAHYFTQFLNQPTAVFLGIEKLATTFNSTVVFADVRVLKRGYYSCTFVPLFNEPKQTAQYEITNTHVHHLEEMIKREPQYWLWSHRRWKFKPEPANA